MPLSADDIRSAFGALSDELATTGADAEIVVVGGAALVLLFGARATTKDVDAYFVRSEASAVRTAAARVAERCALPSDWLNDAAKGFIVGFSTGATVYESANLVVRAASAEQLLAMKLAAWRDAIDRGDAELLLNSLRGSKDEIWDRVQPFVPVPLLDKASYAFEDLWEALRGTP